MSTQAYRDAVELAVDHWNAHDERYFEAYTQDASMHGFPADVPPTVEGIRALFRGMWAAFPDIRVEIEHLGVEDDVAAVHFRVAARIRVSSWAPRRRATVSTLR